MTTRENRPQDYARYPVGSDEYGGLLPHSEEAEQAVLGGLLIPETSKEAFDTVKEKGVIREDFFYEDHRQLFDSIESLVQKNEPVDCVSVGERLVEIFGPSEGILKYIVELWRNTPTAANIHHYAALVKEKSNLRAIFHICKAGCELALGHGAKSESVVDQIDQKIFRYIQNQEYRDFVDISATLNEVINTIEAQCENGDVVTGMTTGLTRLDAITGGLKAGELGIIAARPGMGKTSLGLIISLAVLNQTKTVEEAPVAGTSDLSAAKPDADPAASSDNSPLTKKRSVQIYSMEMSAKLLLLRMLSQVGKFSIKDVQGKTDEAFWDRLCFALGKLYEYQDRLVIDETGALTTSALRAKVRRAARRYGMPSLIMVDYLQLMRAPGKSETRNLEITEISQSLKALAKEMDCPVIALSQLNRSPEGRASKRPVMSDLRDSGSLEQDADLIVFIYRDDVYNADSKDSGTAEIIISKHRNGPTGTVKVAFIAEQTLFADLYEGNAPTAGY